MKKLLLLVALIAFAACTVSEQASFEVVTCPSCPDAYQGFSTCAFFSAANASEQTLVDAGNYAGAGIPIHARGYMHHKFCFNDTHAAFGSANPTTTGLSENANLVVRTDSQVLASNFASEYAFLLRQEEGVYVEEWELNGRVAQQRFCPRGSCEQALVRALLSAQESVVFLAFSFTSKPVAEALVLLHERGVCVRGVIESFGARSQWGRYESLLEAGVGVELASNPGFMHHKAFLVDGELAVVGSYNPSASANERNAETLVFLREPAVARAVFSEFVRLSSGVRCE